MFLAAGEVIEAASGQSWSNFIKSRILLPLEMNRTVTSVRDLVTVDNYATPHKTLSGSSQPIPWMNWDSMAAAGGIISSADDMSNWLRLQLRSGELAGDKRLFSAAASHEMWQPHTVLKSPMKPSARFPSTHFRAYGLGWSLSDYKGVKIVAHGGGYDGMYSQVVLIPEQKIGVVVLTNSMTSISSLLAYRAIDLLLGGEQKDWSQESLEQFNKSRVEFQNRIDQAVKKVAEGTVPSHPLTTYAGKFRCPLYGDACRGTDERQSIGFAPLAVSCSGRRLGASALRYVCDQVASGVCLVRGGHCALRSKCQRRVHQDRTGCPQ